MSTDQRTSGIGGQAVHSVYIGKVVNHLDTTAMGGLEVEIVKRTSGGNVQEKIACVYASPFYGQTPYSGLGRGDDYPSTQKSYGFWAVPPDVGTQVIVLMPEGDYAQAYWVACIPDTGMNFMVPGNSGTTFNKADPSRALPVGEYNKLTDAPATGVDPTKVRKPVNTLAQERLENAGLDRDWVRGTNTSSARREAPSMVFGISTPGPHDRAGPTHRYGPQNAQVNQPYNRLGGSSFVMDDGDMSMHRRTTAKEGPPDYAQTESGDQSGDVTLPANELIRIQTRTGHQIVMHNSEDLIYISHGSGDSWIEMTANGKIDIYSKDSISIRSENDLNFTADRDINFTAAKNINMIAEENARLTVIENLDIRSKNQKTYVEEDCHIQVGQTYFQEQRNLQVHVEESGKITLLQDLDLVTEGDLRLKQRTLHSSADIEHVFTSGSGNFSIKAQSIIQNAATTFEAKGNEMRLQSAAEMSLRSNSKIVVHGGQNVSLGAQNIVSNTDINRSSVQPGQPAGTAETAIIATESERSEEAEKAFYTKRIPAHEPWPEHEHLDPQNFIPDNTLADQEERPEESEAPLFPPIPDTFSKSS